MLDVNKIRFIKDDNKSWSHQLVTYGVDLVILGGAVGLLWLSRLV